MPVSEPAKPPYTIEDTPNLLRITIRNRRNNLTLIQNLIQVSIWMCIGSFFGFPVIAISIIYLVALVLGGQSHAEVSGGIGAIVLFVIWLLVGYLGWSGLLWQINGKDTLEINDRHIRFRRTFSGLGLWRSYNADDIQNFRAEPSPPSLTLLFQVRHRGISNEPLVFTFQSKHIRLGVNLDESEARQIVALIHQRFPQYR
jgi:hypothetical protein